MTIPNCDQIGLVAQRLPAYDTHEGWSSTHFSYNRKGEAEQKTLKKTGS